MPFEHPIIAILGGTGQEGTGLALRWAIAGFTILIGSRREEKARVSAQKINNQLQVSSVYGVSNLEAAKRAEVCILTVIYSAHTEALEGLKNVMDGKILVDATSRVDYQDPKPPVAPCAAEQAQMMLGSKVRIVAAFQNVPAKLLSRNLSQPLDADVLVCSDDTPAAEQVINLAEAAGMNGYYAGPLINSNVVEGLTSILISLNKYYRIKDARIRISGISKEGNHTQ